MANTNKISYRMRSHSIQNYLVTISKGVFLKNEYYNEFKIKNLTYTICNGI